MFCLFVALALIPLCPLNATETIFAVVSRVIKLVSTETRYAGKFSSPNANVMTRGVAVCEEFCHEVSIGTRILEGDAYHPLEIEEIKGSLPIVHFTGLMERMVQEGYCCTQVQRDTKSDKCVAWFEPSTAHLE